MSDDISVHNATKWATGADTLWLVAQANSLHPGRRYTLKIVATDVLGHTGSANITVTTNSPPENGTLGVAPGMGAALQTHFALASRNWVDPDDAFPLLHHSFSYISSLGSKVMLAAQSTISGGGEADAILLPIGNRSVVVDVTDEFGAVGTARFVVDVRLSSDTTNAIHNVTSDIESLLGSNDGATAMTLIAALAEMMSMSNINTNEDGEDKDASSPSSSNTMTQTLLGLAWNASMMILEPDEASVGLSAAALELLVSDSGEERVALDASVQVLAVRLAGRVANESRTLGFITSAARGSLVGALSGVVACNAPGSLPGSIEGVLQNMHGLTLARLAPQEAPVTTHARSLAMSSSVVSCEIVGCTAPSIVASPRFLGGTDARKSPFNLSADTLYEISTAAAASTGGSCDSASIGLMAVSWARTPHIFQAANRGTSTTAINAVGENTSTITTTTTFATPDVNISGLTVTACDREVDVRNLTSAISITLPIVSRVGVDNSSGNTSKMSGVCRSGDSGKSHGVWCESSGELVNVTCPSTLEIDKAWAWNVTCAAREEVAACSYFDTTHGK